MSNEVPTLTAFVTVTPSRCGGDPTVNGTRLTTRMVANSVAGLGSEVVADLYELSREQVLVACWYESEHGRSRKLRKAWKEWRDEYRRTLGGWDDREVPDPPRA